MFLHDDIEVLRPELPRGQFHSVLFDFDGTLSLIREGWPQIMIPLMVEVLHETGTEESEAELTHVVENFVMRLNGRQTIYQMMHLAEEVQKRGGKPLEPLAYKHIYHDRLMQRIDGRLKHLADGTVPPEAWSVPGSRPMLEALRDRGMTLYLASGTDLKYVRNEVQLLGLAEFFGPHIYGAQDDHRAFSKQMIIEQILKENHLEGQQLLGFGDGFVEIEEIRRAGGVAIAVASDEEKRQGVNAWKRNRLVQAGADLVIPDYQPRQPLLDWLFSTQ